MSNLELSLQLFQLLVEFFELRVASELFWDVKGYQKFGKISSFFQGSVVLKKEVINWIDNFTISI